MVGGRNLLAVSFALAPLVLSCGCSTIELDASRRARLSRVVVGEARLASQPISYSGPTIAGYDPFSPWLYAFPILRELTILYALTPPGLWQVHRAYVEMEQSLTARLAREGVRPAEILRRAFSGELERRRIFPEVLSGASGAGAGGANAAVADARFELEVETGIARAGWLSPGVKPWLSVEGRLVDREGRVIWQRAESVSPSERRIEAADAEDYFFDARRFEDALFTESRMLARALVAHLAGDIEE